LGLALFGNFPHYGIFDGFKIGDFSLVVFEYDSCSGLRFVYRSKVREHFSTFCLYTQNAGVESGDVFEVRSRVFLKSSPG